MPDILRHNKTYRERKPAYRFYFIIGYFLVNGQVLAVAGHLGTGCVANHQWHLTLTGCCHSVCSHQVDQELNQLMEK